MLEKIGIIGYGFVGKACHRVFRHNADAIIVDPMYSDHSVADLVAKKPPVTFVCINAPTLEDRTVDASVIYGIFAELKALKYTGIVVLKSTLTPDIVDDLFNTFCTDEFPLAYVYSPEFLREAHWEYDALNPQMIIMAGNWSTCIELRIIYENHSHINSMKFYITDFAGAALVKYAINSFLATKVVFMNQLHQLMVDHHGGDMQPEEWELFKGLLTQDGRLGSSHMDVPGLNNEYGYGGKCFPKDVSAMIGFDKHNRLSLLREAELANTQLRLTGSTAQHELFIFR